jgi:hypothetical protein
LLQTAHDAGIGFIWAFSSIGFSRLHMDNALDMLYYNNHGMFSSILPDEARASDRHK